jgi:hypothetical protein
LVPTQVPDWQESLCVHALPSEHVAPSALAGFEQTPVVALQVPTEWHWSWALHVTGLAPTHVPAWQLSLCVQALPSEQLVPSVLGGFEQTPVAGAQVPTL